MLDGAVMPSMWLPPAVVLLGSSCPCPARVAVIDLMVVDAGDTPMLLVAAAVLGMVALGPTVSLLGPVVDLVVVRLGLVLVLGSIVMVVCVGPVVAGPGQSVYALLCCWVLQFGESVSPPYLSKYGRHINAFCCASGCA